MEAVNYRFREEPGDNNSLGVVRINISNPYGVYMHDTSSKGVFGDDFRYISSGCIRVQNVRDYVAWLLKDTPGWDRAHIDEAIRSGERIDAKLASPVPVYWVYITAWATPDGTVQFRDDIYQRDGFGAGAGVAQAVQAPVPQQETAANNRYNYSTGGNYGGSAPQTLAPMDDETNLHCTRAH
jgi:murein L,D-transpeptidase YcbB/YkuD